MTTTVKKKPVSVQKNTPSSITKFVGKKIGVNIIVTHGKEKYSTKASKEDSEKIMQKIALYNKKPSDSLKNQIVKLLAPKTTEKKKEKEKVETEIKGYKKLAKKEIKSKSKDLVKSKLAIKNRVDKSTSEGKEYIVYVKEGIAMKNFENILMPNLLVFKIQEFLEANISIKPLLNFWSQCLLNPNEVARTRLFEYLSKHKFIITPSGYFVTYRMVKSTDNKKVFTDAHTGTFKIKIGEVVSIPRKDCDEDGSKDCSKGLHVGSPDFIGISKGEGYDKETGQIGTGYIDYNPHYGDQPIIAFVNPRHVVSIPNSETRKLRCCEYYPFKLTTPEEVIQVEDSDYYIYESDYKKLELIELLQSIDKTKLIEYVNTKNSSKIKELEDKIKEGELLLGNDVIPKSLDISEVKDLLLDRVRILENVYPTSIQL